MRQQVCLRQKFHCMKNRVTSIYEQSMLLAAQILLIPAFYLILIGPTFEQQALGHGIYA